MISEEQLLSICRRYSGRQDYYCGGEIPANKLINARKSLRIPSREQVLALINCTVFGSAKDAIAIASSGIYAKNNDSLGPQYLSWKDLSEVTIVGSQQRLTAMDVTFSNGRTLNCIGQTMGVNDGIVPLLNDILNALKAADESLDWFVVVEGAQQGPYSKKAVKQMVSDGVIVPTSASVWRDGMASWMPMQDVSELAVQPRGPAPPPFVPPQPVTPTPPPFPGAEATQQPSPQAPGWAQEPQSATSPGAGTATAAASGTTAPGVAAGNTQNGGARTGGPLDVNSADVDSLLLLPGITLAYARSIEKERRLRLGFTKVEEVGEFLGLQPHQVERLRPMVSFAAYSATGGATAAAGRLIDF